MVFSHSLSLPRIFTDNTRVSRPSLKSSAAWFSNTSSPSSSAASSANRARYPSTSTAQYWCRGPEKIFNRNKDMRERREHGCGKVDIAGSAKWSPAGWIAPIQRFWKKNSNLIYADIPASSTLIWWYLLTRPFRSLLDLGLLMCSDSALWWTHGGEIEYLASPVNERFQEITLVNTPDGLPITLDANYMTQTIWHKLYDTSGLPYPLVINGPRLKLLPVAVWNTITRSPLRIP